MAAGSGEPELAIAAKPDVNRKTIRLWRRCFRQDRLNGCGRLRPGRRRKATDNSDRVRALADATLRTRPKAASLVGANPDVEHLTER